MFANEYEFNEKWNMSYARYWETEIEKIKTKINTKYTDDGKKKLCDLDLFIAETGTECAHSFPFQIGFEVKFGYNSIFNLEREYETLVLLKKSGLIKEIGVILCYTYIGKDDKLEQVKKLIPKDDLILIKLDNRG